MTAGADGWRPERDIELVAGTPAGGGQDRPARALVAALAGLIHVPVRLTNIAGRGGSNAWDYLATHPGDPHVLAINSPTIITNRQLGISDFDDTALTPLVNLYTEYIAFLVRADSAIADGAGLLVRLHDPAGLTIAMATALGNTNHMALAQLVRHAGGDPRALNLHVFDSALHAVADVMAGRAEVAAITAVSAATELAAGNLRALAVSAPQRLSGLYTQTPTWVEQHVPCVIGTWRGVIGTRGLNTAQTGWWDRTLRTATASAAWHEELQRHCWIDTYTGNAAIGVMLDRERVMLGGLLRELGLRADAPDS
jgi:putative tricarboxylic transport membrane protein